MAKGRTKMRTRDEIEKLSKEIAKTMASASIERAQGLTPVYERAKYYLLMEVLLDIRDLLKDPPRKELEK